MLYASHYSTFWSDIIISTENLLHKILELTFLIPLGWAGWVYYAQYIKVFLNQQLNTVRMIHVGDHFVASKIISIM